MTEIPMALHTKQVVGSCGSYGFRLSSFGAETCPTCFVLTHLVSQQAQSLLFLTIHIRSTYVTHLQCLAARNMGALGMKILLTHERGLEKIYYFSENITHVENTIDVRWRQRRGGGVLESSYVVQKEGTYTRIRHCKPRLQSSPKETQITTNHTRQQPTSTNPRQREAQTKLNLNQHIAPTHFFLVKANIERATDIVRKTNDKRPATNLLSLAKGKHDKQSQGKMTETMLLGSTIRGDK